MLTETKPTETTQEEMNLTEIVHYCAENGLALTLLPPDALKQDSKISTMILPPDVTARLLQKEEEAKAASPVSLSSLPRFAAFVKAVREEGLAVHISDEETPKQTRLNFTWEAFFRSISITPEDNEGDAIDPNLLATVELARKHSRNLRVIFNENQDMEFQTTIIVRNGNAPITDASLQTLRRLLEEGKETPAIASA